MKEKGGGVVDQEVLTVRVNITGAHEVKGQTGEVLMLLFGGTCEGEYFQGNILSGAVDTQKQCYGEQRMLSARYMLQGKDRAGESCHIFVENTAVCGQEGMNRTTPKIITDSKELSFLEHSSLYGTIEGVDGGVCIHIYMEESM